jgi:hypothetical protein
MAIFNNIFRYSNSLRAAWSGVLFLAGKNSSLNQNLSDSFLDPSSFPWGKAAEDATNLSPASSVKVKNEWSYTSALPIRFYDVASDNF